MTTLFDQRINRLVNAASAAILRGGRKGVEKESLRVRPDGTLSSLPHPKALGSALTHRYITTDFSEALLEFVTPAYCDTWQTLEFLCDIHKYSYDRLGDELLWVTSMPCRLPADEGIPLALYGSSNVGRMKTIYRRGLGYRYGRRMQTISGVHFNYSLPKPFWSEYQDLENDDGAPAAFRSDAYLGLVRNFRRFGWLVLYLFGASPALCKSFAGSATTGMPDFDRDTVYEPYGTSLRMSDLGYSNRTQAKINISLNSLGDYVADLDAAINTPEPAYQRIGVKVGGEYRQLSANRLQIENEFYSPIRPKRVAYSGERPTAALLRGGVEYVEIRSLDLNVFDPVGINQNAMRFMEAFLVYCLLAESPPLEEGGWVEAGKNQAETARRGRDPALRLTQDGRSRSLSDWGREIVEGTRAVAEVIDRGEGTGEYRQAVDAQAILLDHPSATPSARLLDELDRSGSSFFEFAMQAAQGHKEYFRSLVPLQGERLEQFEQETRSSLERQRDIEAADTLTFDEYLEHYFAGN